jgi:hypothetical protein
LPICAGVLGMVRTTRPVSSPADSFSMEMPAAIDSTSVCGPTTGLSPSITAPMICGLTASTSTLGVRPAACAWMVRP